MVANYLTRAVGLAVVLTALAAGSARAGLIHRYSFKDGPEDSAGKADATLKGGAKITDGKLVLDNADKTSGDSGIGYVEFAGPILPKQGSASIAIWFSARETGAFSRLLDIGAQDSGSGNAFVYLTARNADDNARAAITATDAAAKTNVDTDRLDDGKPHLVVMVIDGTAKKLHLYVDGKEVGTAADLGDNTLDKVKQDHAWMGRSAFDADAALSASVSEMRIYDEALTADQVSAINKAGADALPGK